MIANRPTDTMIILFRVVCQLSKLVISRLKCLSHPTSNHGLDNSAPTVSSSAHWPFKCQKTPKIEQERKKNMEIRCVIQYTFIYRKVLMGNHSNPSNFKLHQFYLYIDTMNAMSITYWHKKNSCRSQSFSRRRSEKKKKKEILLCVCYVWKGRGVMTAEAGPSIIWQFLCYTKVYSFFTFSSSFISDPLKWCEGECENRK